MILSVRVNHLLVFSKLAVALHGLISGRFSQFSSAFNSDQLMAHVCLELTLYYSTVPKLILVIRNLILSVLLNSIFKNLNTFELSLDC